MAQTCAKLESNAVVVGIDVSKDHLDAAQYPSGDLIQTSNDTKGLRTLLRWIDRQRAVHVVFEATGPFHRQQESSGQGRHPILTDQSAACKKVC